MEKIHQPQLGELGYRDPHAESHGKGDKGDEQGLPEQDPGDVPFAHPENAVQSEFLFPPPEKKGIGIKEKKAGEHGDDPPAEGENGKNDLLPPHGGKQLVIQKKGNDIVHHHHAGAGEKIRQIHLFVFPDAVQRELRIEKKFHLPSPPAARSVRVSEIFPYI